MNGASCNRNPAVLGKIRKTGRAAKLISSGEGDKRAQHPRGTEEL